MSWTLFLDESGQDHRNSPYEVLAGIAIEDSKLWPLIRELSDAQDKIFGVRLFEAYGHEAKAKKLLKKKVFQHASQLEPLDPVERTRLSREILEDGTQVTRRRLTALAQAKLAYCQKALTICNQSETRAFASIVPPEAPRPQTEMLRKDYSYLFQRFYHFLNSQADNPMGYLVFDELDKSACHILLGQVSQYFVRTRNGRERSKRIIPEPFFVHSDLTTMVQMADLVAYIISWGVQVPGMLPPSRPELSALANLVMRLQYRQDGAGDYPQYGFKVIRDLRAASDQET